MCLAIPGRLVEFLPGNADQLALVDVVGVKRKINIGLLEDVDLASATDDDTLLRVDEALTKFAAEDPVKAQLVKLRYFVGLSIPEAAATMGMSESTAKRAWAYARAWLYEYLKREDA